MFARRTTGKRTGTRKEFFRRAITGCAVFFVIFAVAVVIPLEPALAQSTTDSSAATTSDSATSGTPPLSPDQSNTNVDTSTAQPSTTNNTPGSTDVTTPATTPTVSPTSDSTPPPAAPTNAPTNPSSGNSASPQAQFTQGSGAPGPGSVAASFFNQSQFKIDENTGAAQITYPISIPPGRNGLQPDVDLSYNSQNSQLGGIFGEGWSINIPYIQRLNKNGVDQLYSTSTPSYFMSSFDGELSTTTVSSSYIARTENGTFNKYTFANNQWTMIDKKGTQYVFGSTSDSSENDPNNASDTYRWMLKTVTDTNGNYVTYSYFKDSGQIYPSSTIYDNTTSTTGPFEIDFLRASSTDNGTSSATGFAVNSNYRVSEIDAKVNGIWVRKYALGYTAGDNGSTTLLSWIAESGENASGTVISLPSSTFNYQVQTPGWTSNPVWTPTISFTGTNSSDIGVRVADVNGDGLPDIVQGYTDVNGSTTSAAYINNGADWTVTSTWNPPISFANNGLDQGFRIADVNGDGLPDIVEGSAGGVAYINTGSGWATSTAWIPPVAFAVNGVDNGARIVDLNGDGLPDIVQSYTDASGVLHNGAWINTGNGWATSTAWTPPTLFIASGTTDVGTRLADINGDGLADIIQAYTDGGGASHFATWFNTGNGWATSTNSAWNSPVVFANNGVDTGARIMDVNGDGLADIAQGSAGGATYLNNGNGWATSIAWASPVAFTLSGVDNGTRIVDVNGDGLPDIVQAYTDSGGVEHTSAYTNNNSFRADLLTGVTYPEGGSSTIAYQSILQLKDPLGNVLNGVPYPVYIVSSVNQNDGLGNIATSSYAYYGGTYYANNPFDHEFAGFTSVKAIDPAGNVTKTYYDTSSGTSSSTGQYADNFSKIGKPYRVENYDNNNDLYKVTVTKWDSASLGGNAAYVFPDNTLEMDYDGTSTHQDLAESYTWNTSTGNQTQKIQWGQVTGSSTGAFTTSTNGYVTNLTYASTTGSNVIGKLSDEILLNQSSTKIQETQYFYDGLSQGNIGTGNLTKQLDWKSGSTYVATAQNTYNSYGLVSQSLDPRNNTTTYTYDAYNLYPATTTNALSQFTNNQYDYSTGKTTQTTDPNKLTFQTLYDGVGRPLQSFEPDQVTTSTLDTKTVYSYTDTPGAVSVHESDYLNATTTVDTYSYYDGLDRLIQTRKSSTDAGTYKVTDQAYNNRGLVQQVSLPYFASSSAKSAATTTSALFTTYTYDPLGRVLTTTNAVGTVSDLYDNWKTTVTDANGNLKDEYHDAFGNLVQVGEHNGSSTYTTSYAYDGLHDLLNLADANGNVRNFIYDGLGRMVSSTDLHATTSSTYGVWNYTYDDAGNLTTRVDPKNQTVNWTYDGLNRALTENYTGASSTAITYTYDACTNGIGRLCTVSSTDAVSLTTKSYDPLGDLASETKTINGVNYTTSYTYDRAGDQLTITNPDTSVVQYTYGTAGLPTGVQEKEPGGSFNPVVSSMDYSPMDQLAIETYADGIVAKNIYDPLQLYRLIGKVTSDNQGQMHMVQGGGGLGPLFTPGAGPNTSFTFIRRYIGAVDNFTVPMGVASLTVSAYGGQGGNAGGGGGAGGLGGAATGTLSVTSGTTYYFVAGGVGANGSSTGSGSGAGSGGGGMSWFSPDNSFDGNVLLVAGGGGGAGGNSFSGSGGIFSGGNGGYGGGGSGGYNIPGASGSGGGGGGWWGGYEGGTSSGGTAATQTSGYAQGQGGPGVNGGINCYGGPGGGGGGLSSASGTVINSCNGWAGAGGGGGGSAYMASTLTNTSTATGMNSGNGYLAITEYPAATVYAPYFPTSSPTQYLLDGVTPLGRGSSTNQGGVAFGALLNSSGTLGVQFQVEVEPLGRNFTNIPNVSSSPFMAPNQVATATFYGPNGAYHWQAQVVDSFGNTSGWQRFSSSTYATDFVITSQSVPTYATETYSGSVGNFVVPSDVAKLTITAYGAQGAASTSCLGPGTCQAAGGFGGETSFTMQTVPGTTFYYSVGGQGTSPVGAGDMTWVSPTSTFSTSTAWTIAGGGGNGGIQVNPGGCGSTGAGTGGIGGGSTGGSGSNGGNNGYGAANGGAGGSQSGGGSGGTGGTGWNNNNGGNGLAATSTVGATGGGGYSCGGGSGGVGGSGYWGGGGGGGGGSGSTSNTSGGGAGGGGGSSYVMATSTFTSTSTASGVNPGNGYISITEYHNAPVINSLNQYLLDGVTSLGDGSSTIQSGVVLGATFGTNATSSTSTASELYNTSLFGDSHLVSYYRLQSNGNAATGTPNLSLNNSPTFDGGRYGNGIDFGSANTNEDATTSYHYSGPLTLHAWVKMNTEITSGHDEAIMEVGSSSINYQVIYDYSNHAYPNLIYRWQCNNVANTDLSYPVSLGTSAWHMIDATFNGTTFTGYLDGVAVVSSTANPGTSCSNGNSNLDLGYIIGSPWWPSAKMDDFAFFNRALTATEIANLYGVTSLVGGAQLQVEVEPAGVTFTSVANVTSSAFVASGTVATTSFSGPSGGYHWQARTVDVLNNTSAWHPFNPAINTPSGFLVDPSSTLTTSLLSYYPMEGNSNDFWGPNNGSDSAMFYGTSYGKVNQGSHNSGSGYITLPIFTVSSSISIAGWFQATSTSGNHDFIVDINNSGGTARIGLQLDSGQLIASMYNGSANPVLYSTSSAYADGNWHFFVETANGMNLTLQVDNGAQQSVSGSQSTWGGNGNRISNLYADSQGFNGNIDELGIWNRLLSSPEVSNLWNSGNGQTMHSLSYGSDFQIDNLYFSYPAYSTTTPQFSNWQLKARNVTSTHSYQVTVNWGLSQPNQATSSITASGTQLLTGVNVSKTLISGDYTDTGDPVGIVASGTLTDITGTSTVISSTSVSFYEKTIPATSNCTSSNIQCISYTYDANGNITKIVDGSASNAAITVSYAYDGLNRLLSASSSNATSGVNYYQAYTYDPVGNLLSGPAGAYTYAGTGYTDPDAVTKIVNGSSTTNFTYDNNGNLTNASSGFAYTWDYNNRMLTASSSNSTSTYGYDFTGQRVSVANGGVTTYYPETTYTVNGTTRTKNIFADGILVGTVTDATTTTAGITLDATSTAKISSASVATSTISVGSGPNELLAILIANGNISATTTGVTVDGVSAKQASLLRNGTQNASVWYVAGLSSGTHNVSTTHSTSTQIALTLASFFGINQSSTIDATSTKNATSNAPSSSVVTSGVGDLILDALDTAATATTTAIGSGQKYLYQNLLQAANNGNYSYQVAAATGTHADSYTLSTSTAWSEALAAFKATTSTTSTSTATNYIFDDHLGGTNLVVNVSGTILETLQYFPFGSIRIDNTTSSYVAVPRKYIGQQYDAATQLNYLNARYQNPAQGQFISEDPMFIALGSPGQLQQLGQDQSSLLADPQRINSYGYGRDNPVTNKDPNGFDYLELSYTRELPGGSWTGGIRIDQNGMDWFAGSGTGYGGGGGVEAEWAPGQNLSHESTVSTNVVGQITDDAGLGIALSKRINGYNTSELYQENTGNSPASFGITLGGGEGGGIDAEGSKPLFIWNQAGALGEQVEELNNGSNITMPHTYLSAPSGSSQASGGGGHMSGNQLAALQAELSTLSLELAQLQSTISMYSSSK